MDAPLPKPWGGRRDAGRCETLCGPLLVFEHTQAERPPVDSSLTSVFVQAALKAQAAPAQRLELT